MFSILRLFNFVVFSHVAAFLDFFAALDFCFSRLVLPFRVVWFFAQNPMSSSTLLLFECHLAFPAYLRQQPFATTQRFRTIPETAHLCGNSRWRPVHG